MTSHRLELTITEGLLARIDEARGHEPRASFVKRLLRRELGDLEKEPDVTGLDRSVCLRDVVWALEHRPYPLGEEEYSAPARFIEREFGANSAVPTGKEGME